MSGSVSTYSQILKEGIFDERFRLGRLNEFEENLDERPDPHEVEALRMEANTWGLLQALIPYVVSPLTLFL